MPRQIKHESSHDLRAHNGPAAPGAIPERFLSLMRKKIQLPFNLLPHLEGTSIALCYGLHNRPSDDHTIVELNTREAHDLLTLLKALEHDLHIRCQKWQKQRSKAPVGFVRRERVEQSRQAVRRAVELLAAELSAAPNPNDPSH